MIWGVFLRSVSIPSKGGASDKKQIDTALQTSKPPLMALRDLTGDSLFLAGDGLSLAHIRAFAILRYFCLAPQGNALLKG